VFVADGGFHENLGVEALLDRRCRLIIASDAGADPNFVFEDFVRLFRRGRLHGIRFLGLDDEKPLTMTDVVPSGEPGKERFSKQHRVFARVRYPEPDAPEGLLVYVKSSVCDPPETFDLWQYRTVHPEFPHDPTMNQFFDTDQFESYRELGYRIGRKLCLDLKPGEWKDRPPDVAQLLAALRRAGVGIGMNGCPAEAATQSVPTRSGSPVRSGDVEARTV
jgi:hypothetical protein